jgi:hypothetical protein
VIVAGGCDGECPTPLIGAVFDSDLVVKEPQLIIDQIVFKQTKRLF